MKTILFTAGLACTACVSAQTNVTIYGTVDAALQSGRTDGKTTTRVESSSIAPTRIGFQGTEDLGGGLQAVFRLEDGFNADTGTIAGTGALFGREAWVGLGSKTAGTLYVGLNYTPLFYSYVTYAQGTLNTLGWGNASNNFTYVPSARVANSVRYTSPVMAGVTIRAIYSLGADDSTTQPKHTGRTAGVGVNYRSGPLSVDVDYVSQDYVATAAATPASPVARGRYLLVGGLYDFGWIKPGFLYQKHSGTPDVVAPIAPTSANPDHWFYEVNAIVRAGANGSFLVSYGQYRKRASSSGDAKSYAVRYDYALSKRSGIYAGIGRVENGSTASFSMNAAGGVGIPTTLGHSLNTGIVGIIHRF